MSFSGVCVGIQPWAVMVQRSPMKDIYPLTVKPVNIGKRVWIMPNVTIIYGVTIGDESVVATGAVVTRDVPPRTLVAGIPAKVIKQL